MPKQDDENTWSDFLNPRYEVPEEVKAKADRRTEDGEKRTRQERKAGRRAVNAYKHTERRRAVDAQKDNLKSMARSNEGIDPKAVVVVVVLIALVVAAAFLIPWWTGNQGKAEAAPVSSSATDTPTSNTAPAASTAGANPTPSYALGNGPQAVATDKPSLPTHEPVKVEPKKPTVDASKPESVVNGWASAYLTQESATDQAWTQWVKGYVDNALVLQEVNKGVFSTGQPLDGKAPVALTGVKITAAPAGTMVDTPVRWSRTVTANVQSAKDRTLTELTFTVTLYRGESGWSMVDAINESWTLK